MAGESNISVGGIEERAQKLEAAQKETPAAAQEPEKKADAPAPEAKAPEAAKPAASEKKAPNDPEELRKWNTKVSMELSDVKKQLEVLAAALNKTAKKPVDWKDLAKDPAKLQAAVEANQKEVEDAWQEKYNTREYENTARITKLENQRRMHDDNYPRWAELQPAIVKLAASADSRVDFTKDPADVLDQMYELAKQTAGEPKAAAPAPTGKTFTEEEMNARIEKAKQDAIAEAQKGLKAEEKGGGVASMGKGVVKGKGGADKAALWSMPLGDLKRAIQQASPE